MKEFSFDIDEALVRGLRRDDRERINSTTLASLNNGKASKYGIIVPEAITTVAAGPSGACPLPKLFKGKSGVDAGAAHVYIVDDDSVREVVDPTAAPGSWTYNALTQHPARTPDSSNETIVNGSFASGSNWTTGANWAISGGNATHTAGSTATLLQAEADQESGDKVNYSTIYKVVFTISGMTTGTITASIATGGTGVAVTTNQTHTQYITAGGTGGKDVIFTPTSTFDGNIDDVSVIELTASGATEDSVDVTFADFQDTWVMCKYGSARTFFNLPYFSSGGSRFMVYDDDLDIGCVLNYKNRLLMGGFNSSATWFSNQRWLDLWEIWKQYSSMSVFTDDDITIRGSTVFWSNMSGGDVHWPFTEEMALFGIPDTDIFDSLRPNIYQALKEKKFGFTFMPFYGEVYNMMQLGNDIIVYGRTGIAIMREGSEEEGLIAEPLLDFGIDSPSAVAGNRSEHVFVDADKSIWRIKAGGVPEHLEGEVLLTGASGIITVAYDQREQDFYINDGAAVSLVVSGGGIGHVYNAPTSVIRFNENLIGIINTVGSNANLEIVTGPIDMGNRGIKTVHVVEVSARDLTNMTIAVDYKYSNVSTWTTSSWLTANSEGWAVPIISGVEFRIRVKSTATLAATSRVDRITVRWKQSDKRSIRSLFGQQAG